MDAHAHVAVWRSVRSLPDFSRLLEVRLVSQFGDGLFQAGLAGALLFNPDRAADPWAIAGAFAVLFLPYSLLGPFAGALGGELLHRRSLQTQDLGHATKVGFGTWFGILFGTALKLAIVLAMLGLFGFLWWLG